jgi:HNH endonuclease
VFVREAPFSEQAARRAIQDAVCWSEALRALGYVPKGHNIRTLQRHVRRWGIDTGHFDPNLARARANARQGTPMSEILVEGSAYSRGSLKKRLFAEGMKERRCELCGQDETWRGQRMSLVLDHINGVSNDHRLENLQILCPNCAATLDTHCGRNLPRERDCATCGTTFEPQTIRHRYCSRSCNPGPPPGIPHPERRKVPRPGCDQLFAEVDANGYLATGRQYGVSDNAVRKWVRQYEWELWEWSNSLPAEGPWDV